MPFSRRKIGVRLRAGFLLLLLIILGIGGALVVGMERVASLADDLFTHPFAVTNAALETQMDMVSLRDLMLRAAVSRDHTQVDVLLAEADRLDDHIQQRLAVVDARFLGDKSKVDEARRQMGEWSLFRQQVAQEVRAGRHEQALQLALGGGSAKYDAAMRNMEYVVAFARAKAAYYVGAGEDEIHTFLLIAAGCVLLAALLAAAISLSLIRTLLVPLGSLRDVIAILASGAEVAVPLQDRRDELGDVARELQALKRHMQARRQAEAESRLLSEALNQSSNMVMITDPHGVIRYVNPRFTAMTGYRKDEAVGRTPALLRSEDTGDDIYAALWGAINSGREWHGEMKDRGKDRQPFWAMVSISPILDAEGRITHFISIHEDITERKLNEQALIAAREQADVANQAKSKMLANMSHELRTPLNAIIGFSSAMSAELFGPLAEKYREYVGDIQYSGEHLLALIDDILDVSAIEAGKLVLHDEVVAVESVVEASLRLVGPRAEANGVRLTQDIAPGIGTVRVDERRFRQMLLNLLTNAIKFTPTGGVVRIHARLKDGGLLLSVTDTGIGMDAEGLAVAMAPFGQIDSAYARKQHGTGLGLPLTRGLVELHGGAMWIDSAPGVGTTVTIRLPAERGLGLVLPA